MTMKSDNLIRKLSAVAVILGVVCLVAPSVSASDDGDAPRQMLEEGSVDGPAIAYALKDTFLTAKEWEREVEHVRSKYDDWEKDTGGDPGRFLNDRFIIVGLSAAGGKIEKIKKGIMWLALYKEFAEEPPSFVNKFMREHRNSLVRLFTEFKWEKASAYIKDREWRRDAEDKKKLVALEKP
jgi:hypothetical protein